MSRAVPAVVRRVLLAVALLALLVAAAQVAAGGFRIDVAGLRFSNNSVVRPLLIALLAVAVLSARSNRAATVGDVHRLEAALDRAAPWLAGIAAAAALATGVIWGTRAAGGSDSYCYIGQAEEFAAGRAVLVEPLAQTSGLPRADLVFAPVGFVPAAGGGAVPMCAPGLSLVMAVALTTSGLTGLHLVVPLLGALAVWTAYLIGRRIHGPVTGACAAVLLAASPVLLYQVVQPMSDVPAAAFWGAALVLLGRGDARGDIGAGVTASLALLTRPNLAPALAPLVCFLIFAPGRELPRPFARFGRALRFASALAPGCALLAWLNLTRYGSPFRTGYGDLEALFSLASVVPNAGRYGEWTLAAHTPLLLLALLAPAAIRGRDARARAFMWMAIGFAATVVACYLPYTVFEAWWYTRFLLPALPVALALAAGTLVSLASRAPARGLIIIPIVFGVAVASLAFARSHDAFRLRDFERRFITAGTYVARTLPADAVVITIQQSGAVRHYGHRPAALWDALPPDGLDEAVAALQRAGRRPFFLLEDWEEKGFRERFLSERLGALDWPASAELPGHVTVRIYDPAARPR
jgi:hypothetical protein